MNLIMSVLPYQVIIENVIQSKMRGKAIYQSYIRFIRIKIKLRKTEKMVSAK